MKDRIAILYFSLTPSKDANRKKWSKSVKLNHKISKSIYETSKNKLLKTGIDVLNYGFNNEIDSSFNHQLSYAIEESFNQGYSQLIVVGNDCPTLSIKDICAVAESCMQDHTSIGETDRGGCYLFTIRPSQWHKQNFLSLPWCTSTLGVALKKYLKAFTAVIQLPNKNDLNCLKDVLSYLQNKRDILVSLLSSLMLYISLYFYEENNNFVSEVIVSSYRGPPQ